MSASTPTPKPPSNPKRATGSVLQPAVKTAKLFKNGRSQAVRLPKEFRFEGTEVRVSKVGDKVILEPLKKQPFDADAWFARLDELGGRDFLPDGIPDEAPAEPDPRKFFDE